MATETGIVIKVRGKYAWVRTVKTSSCEACAARDSCHTLGGGKEMEVEAINDVNAKVGDNVVMDFETASLFKLSFLVYIFPIICMLGGAVLGQEYAPKYNLDPAVYSALLGFVFFFISFFIVRMVGKKLAAKSKYRPRIIRLERVKPKD